MTQSLIQQLIVNYTIVNVSIISITVLFIAHPTESIDCYICGPGADSAFQTAAASASSSETVPESRSCDEFDESQDKTTFVMTCPNNYRGCITQIEGKSII